MLDLLLKRWPTVQSGERAKREHARILKIKRGETKMANGKSDILLLDNFDGQVKVTAGDFCVDSEIRRGAGTSQYRRAFVHNYGDELVINWDNDYSGGVTINGVRTIGGHGQNTEFNDRVSFKANVDCYSKIRFVAAGWSTDVYTDPSYNNSLVVENKPFLGLPPRHVVFKTPVEFQGPVKLSEKIGPVVQEISDVVMELVTLKNAVWELKDRVAKLEQKPD
jgi:hypothetical protein